LIDFVAFNNTTSNHARAGQLFSGLCGHRGCRLTAVLSQVKKLSRVL
jgi:hypothetical protein